MEYKNVHIHINKYIYIYEYLQGDDAQRKRNFLCTTAALCCCCCCRRRAFAFVLCVWMLPLLLLLSMLICVFVIGKIRKESRKTKERKTETEIE